MGIKRWNLSCPPEGAVQTLSEQTGLRPLLCRVLCSRGYAAPEQAQAFISTVGRLSSPYCLRDMDKAVARLRKAMENGERIAVFGDYDCDGITATALLTGYLQAVGADVIYYIPDRERDGYGMNTAAVDFLNEQNVSLIVTVDNGVSSHLEVEYAKGLGIDVIVTDHHTPRDTLPNAVAVVNPHRADCESGLTELAGVGVAFKLVCALEEDEQGGETLEYYSDLVMLGTVADVVPLVRENLVIVRQGLAHLAGTERAGINALMEQSGIMGKKLTAETVAFTIVPRLNAVGRMGPVDEAVELLLTDDVPYAMEIARQVEGYNTKRKEIEEAMMADIDAVLAENPALLRERVLIVAGEGWHHGVVGIVASRVMERTGKPCILLSLDGEEARGSARSLPGFSIIGAIAACSEHLTRYGGHAQAAGLTLPREYCDDFAFQIQAYARQRHPVMPRPSINVDCVLEPRELTVENVSALSVLEPFGSGNKAPCFMLGALSIDRVMPTADGKHVRISLLGGGTGFTAVFFRMSGEAFPYRSGDIVDIVANISLSEYNGRTQLSVVIRDLRRSGIDQESVIQNGEAYACYLRKENAAVTGVNLIPDREDIAVVYRYLRKAQRYRHGPTELYYRLSDSGVGYGKVLVALDVLAELRLVEISGEGELSCFSDPPKVDLESSGILRELRACL